MFLKDSPNQRKRPRQARAQATVQAVLEATSQVLVECGYAKLTTTKVADRAGVSVGTLYQYFRDKAELVRAVHQVHVERAFGALAARALETQSIPLQARIELMLRALIEIKAQRPELSTALHATMLQLDGPAYLKRIIEQTQALVRRLFEAYEDDLVVDDLDHAAFVMTNAVDGVIGSAVATGRLDDPRLIDALTRLVMGYIAKASVPRSA